MSFAKVNDNFEKKTLEETWYLYQMNLHRVHKFSGNETRSFVFGKLAEVPKHSGFNRNGVLKMLNLSFSRRYPQI